MKRRAKQKSGLYVYLDSINVLETGTDEAIAHAKKEYWKAYRSAWRRRQRGKTKQLTIAFTMNEIERIVQAAKQHKQSKTQMVKDACFAYLNKVYIAPDRFALRSIVQLLAMNYNIVNKAFDEGLTPLQTGRLLLQHMQELETTVTEHLKTPKTLEQLIVDTVKNHPDQKTALLQLLNSG